jgi:hypothetical protein
MILLGDFQQLDPVRGALLTDPLWTIWCTMDIQINMLLVLLVKSVKILRFCRCRYLKVPTTAKA